jgi:glycosyltransferase involved in cell wall biosynthesis
MSAAAEVAPGLERLTVPQPIADGHGTAMAPRPTRTAISLIFPCYNEAERLPQTLATYLRQLSGEPGAVEVLVVDDGSTDDTFAVARAVAARDHRVRVIRSQPNHGKGFGVRTGVLEAEGELIVFTDADGSYGPGEVARVTAALADAPVAIGSRPVGWATGPPTRRLASRLFNRAIRVLLFLTRRLGLAVNEVPVRAEERDGSKVQLVVDALGMVRDVLRVRRWAVSGDYDRAVHQADTCTTVKLGAELGRAAEPG